MKNPRILFFLTHPAHFHLFKNVIRRLKEKGFQTPIAIASKDILEKLLQAEGLEYVNLFPQGRRLRGWPIIISTIVFGFKTEWRLFNFLKKNPMGMLVGTDGTLAHLGALCGVPSVLVNEDDSQATPENYIFYPLATRLVLPECCDPGMWRNKRASYSGCHELGYLHPRYFTPNPEIKKALGVGQERYFILRLAELRASHDVGKTGISNSIVESILSLLAPHGRVFISSERALPASLEQYRLKTPVRDIFDVLYYADLFVGDSQTMTAEAAVLGTPSVRFNDFVGQLGYLEELEHRYNLTFGIPTSAPERLYALLNELIKTSNLKGQWQEKRERMLQETTNVPEFMSATIIEIFEKFWEKR